MTDHADLSRRLALAIGHSSNAMRLRNGVLWVIDYGVGVGYSARHDGPPLLPWRRFDYRLWSVIGPIAERYNCFPFRVSPDHWHVLSPFTGRMIEADTAAEAVARAVIGARG